MCVKSVKRMPKRVAGVLLAVVAGGALSSCSVFAPSGSPGFFSHHGGSSEGKAPAGRTWAAVKGTELPIETAPELLGRTRSEPCPYIDSAWLEKTTGQRVTASGVDRRFETPACVFWSYEKEPQATILVRSMRTNQDAVAVVDHFAPIDQTLKAVEPAGWSGGRSRADDKPGTVYAVWKDNLAVVVTSAQDQTVKPEGIAVEVIKNLKL